MINSDSDFMIWNSQIIRSKSLELFYTLWIKSVLLCMISETNLKDSDTFFNPEYMLYRLDRDGVVAVWHCSLAVVFGKGFCQFLGRES